MSKFRSCVGYDIDAGALDQCQRNLDECDIDNVELKQQDLLLLDPSDAALYNIADTVVMNPPFGTKDNEGLYGETIVSYDIFAIKI